MGDPCRLRRSPGGIPQGKLIEAARALYWRAPEQEELNAYGLTVDDFPPPEVDVWPENWPPLQLFIRLSTQWRTGPGGPVGLDYNVLFHEMDRQSLEPDAYDDMQAQIRVIELAALDELHKKD